MERAELERDAARLAIRTIRDALGCEPGDDPAEVAERLRARVAELEAGHLAIAEVMGMVDCDDTGRIGQVATQAQIAEACDRMCCAALEAPDRERMAAEAMRERAAAFLHERADEADGRLRIASDELRIAASLLMTLPLTDDARDDANVCEHGDHPAPDGQRFCSAACQECEGVDAPDGEECAGMCTRDDAQGGER